MEILLTFIAVLLVLLVVVPLAVVLWSSRERAAARSRDEATLAEIARLRSVLDALVRRVQRIERGEAAAPTGERAAAPAALAGGTRPPVPEPGSQPVVGSAPVGAVRPPLAPPHPPSPPSPAPLAAPVRPQPLAAPIFPASPPLSAPTTGEGAGFERELSTRIAVWIGALAIALAGALFVKWSFDRGLLGPTMRVTLGIAFGLALVGVGDRLRRTSANVAQGLVASGIATLFAALLAGTSLYGLIPRPVGFLLLAATTAGAVLLALRHGPLIALLGLLGGFLTPALIGAEEPSAWGLFGYLFLLVGGLNAVSRRRGWWPIAALTLVGAFGWALLALTNLPRFGCATPAPVGVFLLATIAATVVLVVTGEWEDRRVPLGLVWGACGGGVILLGFTASLGGFGTSEWIYFGILSAGCLVLAWRMPDYDGLPWATSVVGAALLLLWGRQAHPDALRLWWTALLLGGLHVAGAYAALWRSAAAERWAALAAASGLAWFLAAYGSSGPSPLPIPWSVQSLFCAALFAGLAVPVHGRRLALPRAELALAALAVACTAFVSLAVPMEFQRSWITVAWALEIPAVAWIAWRLRVPVLDRIVWILAGGVALRLFLNPAVLLDYPIGSGLVFNWLLFGYGLPALAFTAGSAIYRRAGMRLLSEVLESGAIACGFALLTLDVRQYFHPRQLGELGVTLSEWGAFAVVWIVYGLLLLAAHEAVNRRVLDWGGTAIGLWGCALAVLGPCLLGNPLWEPHHVGATLVFNRLLGIYGLPAVLAVVLARSLRRREPPALSIVAACASLGLLFALVSLEVRQGFHGTILAGGTTTNAEMYAYSAAWVLLATALLILGIATRGPVVRAASAVIMALAVCKVFLFDTAQLRDLWRVFSLLGLGASLMLLAFLYQRFVFGDRATRPRPLRPAGTPAAPPGD